MCECGLISTTHHICIVDIYHQAKVPWKFHTQYCKLLGVFTVEQGEKEGEKGGGGSGIEDPSILAHSSTLSYYTSKHS